MSCCSQCPRPACVAETRQGRPLCLLHAFLARIEGRVSDSAAAAQQEKALKLMAIKVFDEICVEVTQQALLSRAAPAAAAVSASNASRLPPPSSRSAAAATAAPRAKPLQSSKPTPSWEVDATPRATMGATPLYQAKREMLDRSLLRARVDATPDVPQDEERRRAITLIGNALYSSVSDLPKDEDDAIPLILATAMNIENACYTAQAEDYRSQVRGILGFVRANSDATDEVVGGSISAAALIARSKERQPGKAQSAWTEPAGIETDVYAYVGKAETWFASLFEPFPSIKYTQNLRTTPAESRGSSDRSDSVRRVTCSVCGTSWTLEEG